MLARFHPAASGDFGLDALHVWPGGEVWFSTETGFSDTELGVVTAGDLLSDQGYVVFRNLELVGGFAPVEDLADFGLDGLFIVTDATAPAPAPQLLEIARPPVSGDHRTELERERSRFPGGKIRDRDRTIQVPRYFPGLGVA